MPDSLRDAVGWIVAALLAVAAAVVLQAFLHRGTGSQQRQHDTALALSAGDPDRGRTVIAASGCGACHTIPGVPGARGRVASSLQGIATRNIIGGVVANTPHNLARWVENPRALNAATAMPNVGLSRQQALDVATYLYLAAQ
jgi:cytochrome c2